MTKFTLSAFADEASPVFDLQLEALKRNGIPLVEVRGVDGKGVLSLTDEELDTVCAKLAAANIGVSAVGSPIGKISILDDFAPHFEQFKRAVEIAKRFGTTRIRMFSFYMPQGEDPEHYFDEVVSRVSQMVDYAKANGVDCCHENEKGIYGDTAERCLELLQSCGGKLRAVFDPANFIQCGVDTVKAYDLLEKYVEYFHIKDALYADGSVVPAGTGEGRVPEIITRAAKQNRTIVLSLEPHLQVFEGLGALESGTLEANRTLPKNAYPSHAASFKAAADAMHSLAKKALSLK